MLHRLEALGYWFNPHAPSARPRPQALVGRWSAARRAAVVAYLRAGATFERYDSGSFCRFDCGVGARELGRRDLFDGRWLWPEGLAHYVLVHGVRLPERFVRHAVRRGPATDPPVRPGQREGLVDERGWLAWGRQRGATIALGRWQVPDWPTRERLERAQRVVLGPGHPGERRAELVLWRPDTGAIVLALADGGLAIVELAPVPGRSATAGRPRIRRLAGWHQWPAR